MKSIEALKRQNNGVPFGLLARLAFKDVVNNKKWATMFMLHVFWGFLGLSLVGSIKSALDTGIHLQSKSFLGADLAIRTRHKLQVEDLNKIEKLIAAAAPSYESQEVMFFYSMVTSGEQKSYQEKSFAVEAEPSNKGYSRLVQIKVLAQQPFYGQIQWQDNERDTSVSDTATGLNNFSGVSPPQNDVHPAQDIQRNPNVWVYPELLIQLRKQVGDEIMVGNQAFTISKVVVDDSSQSLSFASLAPRIYMGKNQLAATDLIQAGSTVTYLKLYKLTANIDLELLKEKLEFEIDKTGVQVLTHRDAGQRATRFLVYLSDYLGLVALVALFLSFIGLTYLIRNHLGSQEKNMAILKALGLKAIHIQCIFLCQLTLLGLGSALLSNLAALGVAPLITYWVADFSPFDLNLHKSIFQFDILLLGLIGGPLIAWPFLGRIRQINTKELFSDQLQWKLPRAFKNLTGFIPLVLLFYFLSIKQSHSWVVGSLFFLGFVGAGLILSIFGSYLLRFCDNHFPSRPLSLRWAVRFLIRNRLTTVLCFLALSLGTLLLSLISNIEHSLQSQMNPTAEPLPNLFLFDIQEEQVVELKHLLAERGLSGVRFSPMVRARLVSLNGNIFQAASEKASSFESREETVAKRYKSRGINLSYRQRISASERIVKGQEFLTPFIGEVPEWPNNEGLKWPEISIEIRFAKSMDLEIGDLLGFDVQGVPITGKVTSFRKVNWSSFQPNFFIQFQPGVLEMAPKVFVASVSDVGKNQVNDPSAKSQLERTALLQNHLVEHLPNISIVDVDRFVLKFGKMLTTVSWTLKFMAGLALLTGLFVLYSINAYQIRQLRSVEIRLLRVLGAAHKKIKWMIFWEMLLISGLAAVAGVALSFFASNQISQLMFDQVSPVPLANLFFTALAATVTSLIAGLVASRSALIETA